MKLIIEGLVLVFCFQSSFSQNTNSKIPYNKNEEVDFSLKYGIFKIGEAHVEFTLNQKSSGAYIQAYAQSTGLAKFIKDIYYKYESFTDALTGLPFKDSRILIEGDYIDTSTVYYDRATRQDSTLIYSLKTKTIVGPKGIYDLLSGFYYYRANFLRDNLPLKEKFSTTTFFIDKIWDLRIIYYGKEIINTKYGPLECLKVKPVTIVGHFFRSSEAMTVWFTNNERFIPVKFSIEFKIGTLYGIITDYKPL
jgi:hypothetical protein